MPDGRVAVHETVHFIAASFTYSSLDFTEVFVPVFCTDRPSVSLMVQENDVPFGNCPPVVTVSANESSKFFTV